MFKIVRMFKWMIGCVMILIVSSGLGLSAGRQKGQDNAQIVWSEFDGATHQIYFSRLNDKTWLQKTRLSNDDRVNLIPSLSTDEKNRTWVVWSAFDGHGIQLSTAYFDGQNWSTTDLPSGMTYNTAPAVVTVNGTAWIVWAGFDGGDDDIFFTRRTSQGWDEPVRVHPDNAVPDILPTIWLDANGTVQVRWYGFDGNVYQPFTSQWREKEWSAPIVENADVTGQPTDSPAISASDIPEFVREPDKATMVFPDRTADRRSFSLRKQIDRIKPND